MLFGLWGCPKSHIPQNSWDTSIRIRLLIHIRQRCQSELIACWTFKESIALIRGDTVIHIQFLCFTEIQNEAGQSRARKNSNFRVCIFGTTNTVNSTMKWKFHSVPMQTTLTGDFLELNETVCCLHSDGKYFGV